ncbi:MAG TPA: hypothetical protein VNL94_06145, partial [Candidatus Binatia bacterium]|nr:hypothetical protein [Candidatus Binatia bacterium]
TEATAGRGAMSGRDRPGGAALHGHGLLARLLPDVARKVPHGYVVEVGTTREKLPGQGSTVELAALATELGLPFVTVDMDPANTEQARRDLGERNGVEAVTALGEEFLARFDRPVVAAYLDAFDIQHGKHSDYRVSRYREFLGTEITDEGAAAMHLACAEALMPRVVPGGLVVIDDTWSDGEGFGGKGRDAVPALLDGGFRIVARTKTAVALQREPGPPIVRAARRALRRIMAAVRRTLRPPRSR